MKSSTIAAGALAVAAIGGGAWWLTQGAAPGSTALDVAAVAQDAEVDTSMVRDIVLGEADAPVTVVEYASFTCPHCARFHEEVFPALKEEYVDTGRVRFEYREVYFDRYGLWAGMVARCGGDDDSYLAVTDLVYENQREWTEGAPAQVVEALRAIGVEAGIEGEAIDACLEDGPMAEALVATYEANAQADGIRATPSFLIDGELVANMPLDEFREALDEALGE